MAITFEDWSTGGVIIDDDQPYDDDVRIGGTLLLDETEAVQVRDELLRRYPLEKVEAPKLAEPAPPSLADAKADGVGLLCKSHESARAKAAVTADEERLIFALAKACLKSDDLQTRLNEALSSHAKLEAKIHNLNKALKALIGE